MAKKKSKDGLPQRKRIKFDVNADIDQTRYLKVYAVQCMNDNSSPCTWILNTLNKGIDDRKYTKKVGRFHFLISHKIDCVYMNSLKIWQLVWIQLITNQ